MDVCEMTWMLRDDMDVAIIELLCRDMAGWLFFRGWRLLS